MKIESNIPIPPSSKEGGNTHIVRKMKVGDSVWIDSNSKKENFRFNATRIGARIITRKENDGFRVWLIAAPKE